MTWRSLAVGSLVLIGIVAKLTSQKFVFQEPVKSQQLKAWRKYARESDNEARRRLALNDR